MANSRYEGASGALLRQLRFPLKCSKEEVVSEGLSIENYFSEIHKLRVYS